MSETSRSYDESWFPGMGAPVVPPPDPNATGAIAGTPGSFTPVPNTPPSNAAQATAWGVTALPATDWTIGQYVQGSTAGVGGEMNWSGTAWVAGRSAVTAEQIAAMTIDDVKDFIRANPTLLAEVADLERNGKNRATLVKWLDDLLAEEAAADA